MKRYSVILAAGKGTRMKSRDVNRSKVSFPILGKALVNYVLDVCEHVVHPVIVEQALQLAPSG